MRIKLKKHRILLLAGVLLVLLVNMTLQDRISQSELVIMQPRLHHPTLAELKQFLSEDSVSENAAARPTYVCMNFAADLKANANQIGLNLSYVQVNFVVTWQGRNFTYGHSLNGALINGTGQVWIEPQSDQIYQNLLDVVRLQFIASDGIVILNHIQVW